MEAVQEIPAGNKTKEIAFHQGVPSPCGIVHHAQESVKSEVTKWDAEKPHLTSIVRGQTLGGCRQ